MEPRRAAAIALYPKDKHTHAWVFMDLITGFTFSSSKWELVPIPDVVIDRISKFDETMKMERKRTDELPPPLIDLRYKENSDNGDILRDEDNYDMHVPDCIIVNESTTILPTD